MKTQLLAFLIVFLVCSFPAVAEDRTVDLHSHPFMKPGMTFMFHGQFNGPLMARSWKSRFSTQINPEALEKSEIGIAVVALYAHPILTFNNPRAAIRKEIAEAREFVATHPNWIIARDAEAARLAVAQGKRVLVLSLEGASGILETEEDLKEFIDQGGIRIVTFLHLTDDHFGGVAFMKGYHAMSTPVRWFIELFNPTFSDGVKVNARGLTSLGRQMAQALIQRKVWIDLSHSSDAAQRDLIPMLEQAGQPLLYTHGGLRSLAESERAVSASQLEAVRRTDGLVGICPSEDVGHGFAAFVTQYTEAVGVLGNQNVLVGTDFNGALPHLPPTIGTGTDLDQWGLWNIGQMGEFWRALRNVKAPVPAHLSEQLDSFIDKWSRVTR